MTHKFAFAVAVLFALLYIFFRLLAFAAILLSIFPNISLTFILWYIFGLFFLLLFFHIYLQLYPCHRQGNCQRFIILASKISVTSTLFYLVYFFFFLWCTLFLLYFISLLWLSFLQSLFNALLLTVRLISKIYKCTHL